MLVGLESTVSPANLNYPVLVAPGGFEPACLPIMSRLLIPDELQGLKQKKGLAEAKPVNSAGYGSGVISDRTFLTSPTVPEQRGATRP